eukprot:scaffold69175_cov60-Phaeocystis_antarctica.AAC.3
MAPQAEPTPKLTTIASSVAAAGSSPGGSQAPSAPARNSAVRRSCTKVPRAHANSRMTRQSVTSRTPSTHAPMRVPSEVRGRPLQRSLRQSGSAMERTQPKKVDQVSAAVESALAKQVSSVAPGGALPLPSSHMPSGVPIRRQPKGTSAYSSCGGASPSGEDTTASASESASASAFASACGWACGCGWTSPDGGAASVSSPHRSNDASAASCAAASATPLPTMGGAGAEGPAGAADPAGRGGRSSGAIAALIAPKQRSSGCGGDAAAASAEVACGTRRSLLMCSAVLLGSICGSRSPCAWAASSSCSNCGCGGVSPSLSPSSAVRIVPKSCRAPSRSGKVPWRVAAREPRSPQPGRRAAQPAAAGGHHTRTVQHPAQPQRRHALGDGDGPQGRACDEYRAVVVEGGGATEARRGEQHVRRLLGATRGDTREAGGAATPLHDGDHAAQQQCEHDDQRV